MDSSYHRKGILYRSLSQLRSKEKAVCSPACCRSAGDYRAGEVVSGIGGMLLRPPADDPGGAGLVAKITVWGIRNFRERRSRKRAFPPMKAQKYRRRCAEFCMRSLHCFGVAAGNMLRYFCLAALRKVLAHLRQYILCGKGSNGYFCRNRAREKHFGKKSAEKENLPNEKSGETSPLF